MRDKRRNLLRAHLLRNEAHFQCDCMSAAHRKNGKTRLNGEVFMYHWNLYTRSIREGMKSL